MTFRELIELSVNQRMIGQFFAFFSTEVTTCQDPEAVKTLFSQPT